MKRETREKIQEALDKLEMALDGAILSRDKVRLNLQEAVEALAAEPDEPMRCPSCECIVDKYGHGHHSVADCIFMHLEQHSPTVSKSVEELVATIEDEAWASGIPPAVYIQSFLDAQIAVEARKQWPAIKAERDELLVKLKESYDRSNQLKEVCIKAAWDFCCGVSGFDNYPATLENLRGAIIKYVANLDASRTKTMQEIISEMLMNPAYVHSIKKG